MLMELPLTNAHKRVLLPVSSCGKSHQHQGHTHSRTKRFPAPQTDTYWCKGTTPVHESAPVIEASAALGMQLLCAARKSI